MRTKVVSKHFWMRYSITYCVCSSTIHSCVSAGMAIRVEHITTLFFPSSMRKMNGHDQYQCKIEKNEIHRHILWCPVLPHNEFWPFLSPLPFFKNPTSSAVFWPKRPTILNFYPTRNFGHFLGRLLKDVLECFQICGPASSPHTVSIVSCVFLCVFLLSLALALALAAFFCLTEDLVRCTLCSVWHGCLYQWSLYSLRLYKAINTENKTQKKTKMNRNKQQRKTLGDKQKRPCFWWKRRWPKAGDIFTKNTAYARLGV